MFTQYVQGPDREIAVRGTLKWDAQVDFIDKLASPEEVVMRLRRLMGTTPDTIRLGSKISIDAANEMVYVHRDDNTIPISELHGLRFDILQELASTWYRSPGELVPFARLMRFTEGEDPRASIRVRIREIKVAIGNALGVKFGAGDLIINIRDRGYRLVPPD
jgi:DNA-binding response OmpR family regulator